MATSLVLDPSGTLCQPFVSGIKPRPLWVLHPIGAPKLHPQTKVVSKPRTLRKKIPKRKRKDEEAVLPPPKPPKAKVMAKVVTKKVISPKKQPRKGYRVTVLGIRGKFFDDPPVFPSKTACLRHYIKWTRGNVTDDFEDWVVMNEVDCKVEKF